MISAKTAANLKKTASRFVVYMLLTCLSFVILYPLFGRFMISLMSESDINNDTVRFITQNFTLSNYSDALYYTDYMVSFLKTTGLVILFSLCQVLSSVVIAYGMARFRLKINGILFIFVLLTLIIPPQLISLPLYFQFKNFNLLGLLGTEGISLLGNPFSIVLLCLTGVGLKSGLLIFMLRQYFMGFPKELEEAAYVDGAGTFRTFTQIALPTAAPMLVTIFLFSVVWQWTDEYYISTFMPGNDLLQSQLLRLGSALVFETMNKTDVNSTIWASLTSNAAYLLYILPVLMLFLFMQRYFIESVERTGIVG